MSSEDFYAKRLESNAARMRKCPTGQEDIFRRRLQQTGIRFLSQVAIGRYILDFVIPEKMIVFELDGNRHYTPEAVGYDKARTEFLISLGFKVRRIHNSKAATYRVSRLRFKAAAKQGAFEEAVRKGNRMMRECRTLKGQHIEVAQIDREQKKVVKANGLRKPVLIKRGR